MISQTKANTILNCLLAKGDMSQPSNVYLGLCATEPAVDGTITGEPTAASYARKQIVSSRSGSSSSSLVYQSEFSAAANGVIVNAKEIQMVAAREAWGDLKYFFLSESASGNAFMWGKIYSKTGTEGITVGAETVPVFYEGQLRASIDVALEPIVASSTEA